MAEPRGYEPVAPPFRTENYEMRYWPERRQWYIVNRQTGNSIGNPTENRGKAERWMVRCQEDYEAGRTIGSRQVAQRTPHTGLQGEVR